MCESMVRVLPTNIKAGNATETILYEVTLAYPGQELSGEWCTEEATL